MKTCKRCGETKPLDEFGKKAKALDGLNRWCKECSRLATAVYRRNNPEKDAASNRASAAKTRRNHPDTVRERKRAWSKTTAGLRLHSITQARRRGRVRSTELSKYEKMLEKAVYHERDILSQLWGVPWHVDHVVPLAKGGAHHPDNLRPLLGTLNIEKGSKCLVL